MISKRRIVIAAAVTSMMVLALRAGCGSPAPDRQLAERFDAMCEIARGNIATPVRGVKQLGRYLAEHAGHMLGEWGDTLAAIERIADDDQHDDRARVARDRLREPLLRCEAAWNDFADAVEADAEARQLVDRASERLGRTIGIIFDGSSGLERLRLPRQLGRAIGH